MLAWCFIRENKLKSGEPELHDNDTHGSIQILDALQHAKGPIVCRVDITGNISKVDDKIFGWERKVLWMLNATNILHGFACRCAEDALAMIDNPDPRSIAAIKAKRDWMAGKISDEELYTINIAAWNASKDTKTKAEEAAGVAVAWATDNISVCVAARDAAWSAARIADNTDTKNAIKDVQNKRLTAMICAEAKKKGLI